MNYATDTKNVHFMIKEEDSDNKCTNLSINSVLKEYSSFVFLVSMKYLKNEEKSKHTAITVFKKLRSCLGNTQISNIKQWLYTETVKICND